MPQDGWDPAQYERFRAERSKPFYDLMEMVVPRAGMRVVDLGCGIGDLTRVLHERLRAQETVGIDRSAAMLDKAAKLAGGGLSFRRGEIEEFAEEDAYDLVFSNSALHWVPDHPALLGRLARALRAGGQLAAQMPDMYRHPSHLVAAEVAQEFRQELGGYVHREYVLEPPEYRAILESADFRQHKVEVRYYDHELASRKDVMEWVKGTLLVQYKERLTVEAYGRFLERYRENLLPRLEDARPYVYSYRRILIWGKKAQRAKVVELTRERRRISRRKPA
ncbi:MAG TPA: methyltransferase domain-containing protein [Terriglobales bacterium]|nr:methyltransferase domain-containing protein [Terriglobales bacterium]